LAAVSGPTASPSAVPPYAPSRPRTAGTTVVLVLRAFLPTCLIRQSLRQRQVPDADVARQHAAITASLPTLVGEGHAAVVQMPADGLWRHVTHPVRTGNFARMSVAVVTLGP
jgi:hypothetical protein